MVANHNFAFESYIELINQIDNPDKGIHSLSYFIKKNYRCCFDITDDSYLKLGNPIVAIGHSKNFYQILNIAEIKIACGIAQDIDPFILDYVDYVICEEKTLCQFLERLL